MTKGSDGREVEHEDGFNWVERETEDGYITLEFESPFNVEDPVALLEAIRSEYGDEVAIEILDDQTVEVDLFGGA